ncbi:hypothetical protein, partial [Methanobrevibacter gottschalkii]|uniref:hypothetical protein n=1 Tax=Methanobrevibacter gottschalkii TaxID=190974 RepID=UPI0038CFC7A2
GKRYTLSGNVFTEVAEADTVIAALGHSWGAINYVWAADNSTVTASRNCLREGCSETETEQVGTTSSVTAATCTTAGKTHYESAAFANSAFAVQSKDVEIAKLGHNMTAHAAVSATCTTAGNSAYWSCDRCNKFFSDENGNTEIAENSWVIAALNHNWGNWTQVDDTNHQRVCANDNSHTETAAHGWDEGTVTTPATCAATGVKTYTCSVCSGTKTETVAVDGANHTNLQHVAANDSTCLAAGNIEYWYCSGCQKYFSNAAGTTAITQAATVLNALGHDWLTPTYTWSADNSSVTATRVCDRDADHVETETAEATPAVKTLATCAAKGTTTYTATFTNDAFSLQSKDVEDIAIDASNHT